MGTVDIGIDGVLVGPNMKACTWLAVVDGARDEEDCAVLAVLMVIPVCRLLASASKLSSVVLDSARCNSRMNVLSVKLPHLWHY